MATKIDKFIAEKTGMDPAEVQAKLEALNNDKNAQANNPEFMAAVGQYFNENNGAGKFDNPTQEQLAAFGAMAISDVARDNDFAQKMEEAMNRRKEQEAAKPPAQRQAEAQEKKAGIDDLKKQMEEMKRQRQEQREAYEKSRKKPETEPPEQKNDGQTLKEQLSELSKMRMDGVETRVGSSGVEAKSYSGPTEVRSTPEAWAMINEAGNLMAERFKEAGIDVDPHHFTYLHNSGNSEWSKDPMDNAQFEQAEAIMKQSLLEAGVPEGNLMIFMDTMGIHSYEDAAPVNVAPKNDYQTLKEQLSELSKMRMDGEETRVGNEEVSAPEDLSNVSIGGDTPNPYANEPETPPPGLDTNGPEETFINIGGDTPNPYASEPETPPPGLDTNGPEETFINIGGDTPNPHASEPPPVEDPTERWAKAKEDFDPSQVHTGLTTDIPSNEGLEQFANSRMDALAAFADKFKNDSSSILLGNKQGSVEMATTVIETASLKTSTTISNMTTSIETTSIERTANVDMTTSVTMNVQMPS